MIDIIILGATGSIGKQAISLIKYSQEYNLIGFTFDRNYKEALKLGSSCGSATAFSGGIGKKELIDTLKDEIEVKEICKINM